MPASPRRTRVSWGLPPSRNLRGDRSSWAFHRCISRSLCSGRHSLEAPSSRGRRMDTCLRSPQSCSVRHPQLSGRCGGGRQRYSRGRCPDWKCSWQLHVHSSSLPRCRRPCIRERFPLGSLPLPRRRVQTPMRALRPVGRRSTTGRLSRLPYLGAWLFRSSCRGRELHPVSMLHFALHYPQRRSR